MSMKANVHGIEVEGTPEEIAEFKLKLEKQISDAIDKMKEYKVPNYTYPQYHFPPIYIGTPVTDPYKWNEITCKQDKNTFLLNQ